MRKNGFGDTYCHTVDEAQRLLGEHDSNGGVYVARIDPPAGASLACAEVVENESGELVCYLEADTVADVRSLAIALDLTIDL